MPRLYLFFITLFLILFFFSWCFSLFFFSISSPFAVLFFFRFPIHIPFFFSFFSIILISHSFPILFRFSIMVYVFPDFFLLVIFPNVYDFFLWAFFFNIRTRIYDVRTSSTRLFFVPSSAQITKKHTQLLELACCRASTTQSTAQHSATSHAQGSEAVRADQTVTTKASRQSWREPACRREHLQLTVFSKPTKKSKFARPESIYRYYRTYKQLVTRE